MKVAKSKMMTEVCRFVCVSHDVQVSSVYFTNIFTSVNLLNRVQKIIKQLFLNEVEQNMVCVFASGKQINYSAEASN